MQPFRDLGIQDSILTNLHLMGFTQPTPIQAQTIPLALEGRDILGSAQTGTGKTAAFGIPLVTKLLSDPKGTALVLTPTRELATQVMTQLKAMLGKHHKLQSALLIGGDPILKQLNQLRNRPRLIVGTPGRINDHLKRRSLSLQTTNFLVLDETDRMLDMGFSVQIEQMLQHLPQKRQTLLFSATLPQHIAKIAETYLTNPVRVATNPTSTPSPKIKQQILKMHAADKYDQLLSQLNDRKGSVIVFVKTKHATEKMAINLLKAGHSADAIHGNLRQKKRDTVIRGFRDQKHRILVATDVAARGLDIPHVAHVINYDLPQCAQDYIHRIGRTARGGAQGAAISLITPEDTSKWKAIEHLLHPDRKDWEKKPSLSKKRNTSPRKGKPPPFRGKPKKKRGYSKKAA